MSKTTIVTNDSPISLKEISNADAIYNIVINSQSNNIEYCLGDVVIPAFYQHDNKCISIFTKTKPIYFLAMTCHSDKLTIRSDSYPVEVSWEEMTFSDFEHEKIMLRGFDVHYDQTYLTDALTIRYMGGMVGIPVKLDDDDVPRIEYSVVADTNCSCCYCN